MGSGITRVISDVHYGDRSTRVRSLAQLSPVFEGASALILNGDTFDSRPSPHPEQTRALRDEVLAFFGSTGLPVTFVTGNHDPDFSPVHSLDLDDGRVFATHGDILFDDIVPWGRDAKTIRVKLAAALEAISTRGEPSLEERLKALRAVAATIPQRHQSERRRLRYALRYVADTVWPPHRTLFMLRAWREMPARASALAARHRPKARFVLMGHTHRPGIWPTPSGVTVINTGTYCPPFGPIAVDLQPGRLDVRRIDRRGDEFRVGETLARFTL